MYAKDLIDYVRRSIGEPRALCTRMSICRSEKSLEVVFKEMEPKAACTVCVMAVSQVQRMINESEAEIIKQLLEGCALLPNEFQQYCRLIVNMYAKDLIDYVRRTIGEPRKLCQSIGACPLEQLSIINKNDKALCTFCKLGVDMVRRLINETEEEIIRELLKECVKLDPPTDRICRTLVEVLGRDIIKYIKEYGGSPDEVCKRFRICKAIVTPKVELPEVPQQICQFCIYGIQTIVNFLNESEDFIIEKANEQCNLVRDQTAKRICLTLVSLFGRQIIRFVKEYGAENPREVCRRFSLCSNKLIKFPVVRPEAVCTACVLAVSQIQRMINESEEEIIRTLLHQCTFLPNDFQQYCRLIVNLYAKDLIDYVRRSIGQPRQLCEYIGACRPPNKEIAIKSSQKCYFSCLYLEYSKIATRKFLNMCDVNKKCYHKILSKDTFKCIDRC